MPSKVFGGKSPLQTLIPEVQLFPIHPKVFECTYFVHIPKQQRDKLDPKAIKCIFVGYQVHKKGTTAILQKRGKYLLTWMCDFIKVYRIILPRIK